MIGARSPLPPGVAGAAAVSYVARFRPDFDALAAAGCTVSPDLPARADLAILAIPRNRVQALAQVAAAFSMLPEGGWLLLDGQKTDGIEALIRQIRAAMPVAGVAARAHGKIAWVARPDPLPDALADWRSAAVPRRNADGFLTAPGMFSADATDPATTALIAHLPGDATGSAVDLGAGWGALSAALLARAPGLEALDLIEADLDALEAARSNVTDPRSSFHWADATGWSGGPYDLAVSNPPFHVSRAPDPALGRAFIAAAARLLSPRGRFLMVANRQLPYEPALDAQFRHWEEIFADGRYKIISARQPRKAKARA